MTSSISRVAHAGGQTRSLIGLAAVILLGVVCFRYTYRLGFDWGDMGSYAQIARELSEGGSPADFIGYGPLWHFFGAWIFDLFGLNFTALLIAFHMLIIICAAAIMTAEHRATGLAWAGVVVAFAIILVPPFLASTMRLVCLALFAWPLIALARAEPERDQVETMAASAAIAVILMLRPDFAYLYTAALGAMLVWRASLVAGGFREKLIYLCRRAIYYFAVLFIVILPLVLDSIRRGYSRHLFLEIASYPSRLLFFLTLRSNTAGDAGEVTSALLKMPPVGAIFDPASGQQVFALLIYSTSAVLVATGPVLLWRALRSRSDARLDQPAFAVWLLAASQWPIFGFFRPSWVHFVGFMHGYLLLAVGLCVWLSGRWRPTGRGTLTWSRIFQALLAAQIVLFVGYGMVDGETGLFAKLKDRDTVFDGRNGVRVRVSAAEKRIYDNVATIIEQNSKAGDRIVCVPYCAGFAFMTDRMPLFREHYVDDTTPAVYKGWIDRAIARTDEIRPPVIIVLDWGPNGTESSRFDNWARRYIDHVSASYPIKGRFEMGTIWLRGGPDRPPVTRIPVVDYGPKSATLGVPFNQQPSGQSALWIKLKSDIGGGAVVRLDGHDIPAVVTNEGVSALVPADLISRPGLIELKVVNKLRNQESDTVTLMLSP